MFNYCSKRKQIFHFSLFIFTVHFSLSTYSSCSGCARPMKTALSMVKT